LRVLALVPARGGSKGVPGKNIRPLARKPLIAWTIDAALEARSLDRVVVTTDDREIADISLACGAEVPFLRPPKFAQDDTPMLDVVQHAVRELDRSGYHVDVVMLLQPTSPLRTSEHIEEACRRFASYPEADSLVSCISVPHIFHPASVMRTNDEGFLVPYVEGPAPTRRQDKGPVFARNGPAICMTRADRVVDYLFGGNLVAYPMDEDVSIDIDDEADFGRAEQWLDENK
jgi:CMP-N,N'-diacetyllegionaminic acid synthase